MKKYAIQSKTFKSYEPNVEPASNDDTSYEHQLWQPMVKDYFFSGR